MPSRSGLVYKPSESVSIRYVPALPDKPGKDRSNGEGGSKCPVDPEIVGDGPRCPFRLSGWGVVEETGAEDSLWHCKLKETLHSGAESISLHNTDGNKG